MAHIPPLDMDGHPELQPVFATAAAAMGFVPNSTRTMAHMRQLPFVFSALFGTIMGGDAKAIFAGLQEVLPEQNAAEENLPAELLQLIAYCVSLSAGCRYCQAHTGHNTERVSGAPELQAERLAQVLNYETATCFSAAERAAIGLALAAGQVPNASGSEHFAQLRPHFSERQQVQIVAVISLFGFLNRWNDTLATTLEQAPIDFAKQTLADGGWSLSKHGVE
ncbi:MAG: carboxymuconolactone decarboxylase family protein [Candidatus Azotimanducaceae bacterium]|jgi:alkylhydroperoxidase family enzyme